MLHQKKSVQQFFKKAIRVIGLIFFCTNALHVQQIDSVLKGGHAIDPKNKIDEQMDVAINNPNRATVEDVTKARKNFAD